MDSIVALTAHFVAPQYMFLISTAAYIGASLFTPEEPLEIQEVTVETGLVPVLPSELISTNIYQTPQPTTSSNLLFSQLALIGIYSLYLMINSRKHTESKIITSKCHERKIEEPVELLEELSNQNFTPTTQIIYEFGSKRNEQLFEYLKSVVNPGDIDEGYCTDSYCGEWDYTDSYCGEWDDTDSYSEEWDYSRMGADNTANPEWNWSQYHTINIGYADLLIQTRCIQAYTFQVQEIHFIHITFKPIYDNDAIDIEPSYLPLIIRILCMFHIQNKFMKLKGRNEAKSKVYKEIESYQTNDECRLIEIESDEEFIDELGITQLDITEYEINEVVINEAEIEVNYDEEVIDGLDMRGDEINYVNDVNDDDEEVNGELDIIRGEVGDSTGLNITESELNVRDINDDEVNGELGKSTGIAESVGVNDEGLNSGLDTIRGEIGDSVRLGESEVDVNAEEANGELGIIGGNGPTQLHSTECEHNESQIDVDFNEEVIGNVYSTNGELGLKMVEEQEEKEEEEEEEAIEVRSDEQAVGNVYFTDQQLDDLELGIKDSHSIQISEPKQSNKRRKSKFCKLCRDNTHFTGECKVQATSPPPPPPSSSSSEGQSEGSTTTTTPPAASNQVLEPEEVTTHFTKDYNNNRQKRYYNNTYRYNYAYNNRYNQKYNNNDNYKDKYKYDNHNYSYNRRFNNDDMDKPWR